MQVPFQTNTLYYGDCLDIMRAFPTECIDLIYLDPPFNSNKKYSKVFRDSGLSIDPQIKAFDDTWIWDPQSQLRVETVKNSIANPASRVIGAFEIFMPQSKMLSYTSYMAERIFEMYHVMKNGASIYLHCDSYASHYLKIVMDAIFGTDNFRNDIAWCYRGGGVPNNAFAHKHDNILFYVKNGKNVFNRQYIPYPKANRKLVSGKGSVSIDGKKRDLDRGASMPDWWTDINSLQTLSSERLGYPTQKPIALLDRIIQTSSNPGDIVLDPFAGCGTSIEAALKNNRQVIGIDILPFALRLINESRVKSNGITPLLIEGVPVDIETARLLADTNYFSFQDWAISLVDGLAANPQKNRDDGIDGFGMFYTKPDNKSSKGIVVQVTGASGSQKAKFERLEHTVRNNNAAMGILIALEPQRAGKNWKHSLESIIMGTTVYEPLQCISIEEYYRNNQKWDSILNIPPLANPWTGKQMPQLSLLDNN